jgi:hypothetical protein
MAMGVDLLVMYICHTRTARGHIPISSIVVFAMAQQITIVESAHDMDFLTVASQF